MSSKGQDAYQYAIAEVGKVYEDAPDGESLLQTILASFSKHFSNPPTRCFEEILQKNFTIEEMRCAMFLPSDDQVRYYPTILHMTRNLPDDRVSELRVRSTVLSLVYLVHRKSWSFLEEFVLCGGLGEISWMITDENFYIRGQAFEILLSVTDCDTFDWFHHHEGKTSTRALHHRLMGLSQHPNFLSGLLENRKKSYPGGSLRALQLLAFWISWVRAVNTANHVLILSDTLLQEIKLWSEGQGEDLCEDEVNLAKTIHLDFSYEQFHREDSPDREMGTAEMSPQVTPGRSDSNSSSYGKSNSNSDRSCNSIGISISDSISDSRAHCDTADASEIINDTDTDIGRPAVFVSGFETSEYAGCDTDTDVCRTLPSLRLDGNGILEPFGTASISTEETLLFAVDCEKVISSEESSSSSSHALYPVLLQCLKEVMENAQSLKIEGNELFKISEYKESLRCYEEAICLIEPMCEEVLHCNQKDHPSMAVAGTSGSSSDSGNADEKSKMPPAVANLMASLHFNCASSNWKLSELKEAATLSAGQTRVSHEAKCESYCRSALSFDGTHCKSVYRLSCMLLQQGRSIEALEVIERYTATSASELDETMKAVRRKCLAAAMARVEGSTEGMGYQRQQESPVSDSAVTAAVNRLALSDRRSASAGISEAAIGSRAAKVLRALQTRASRVKGQGKGEGEGGSAAIAPISLSSFSARDKKDTSSRSGRVFDEEENRNLKTLLGKPLEVVGDHSSKKGTIAPHAVQTSNAQTKKKGPKKADAKASKVAAMNACEAYSKLRSLSALFERSFSSARELVKGEDGYEDEDSGAAAAVGSGSNAATRKQLEDLYDVMDGHVKSAIQALEEIWTRNMTLKKAMTALIEEDFLHFLLTIAVKCSLHKTEDGESSLSYELIALKLLRQLRTVERFSTVFNLTVYGNEKLKTSLGKALDILLHSVEDGKINIFTASQNAVTSNSKENTQEKKKAEIDVQKNLETISEVRSLLK